jgi:hypothetical protein
LAVPRISHTLRILLLAAFLACTAGCDRVLQLGLTTEPSDTGTAPGDGGDTDDEDAGPDASDTDTGSDTDDPDGSPDGSPGDGGAD